MQIDPHERVLAVFDAFLRFAREAAVSPPARNAPREPARTAADTLDDATRPALNAPPPDQTDEHPIVAGDFDVAVPTRVSALSAAMASSTAPRAEGTDEWDEPTRSRPDLVSELRASSAAMELPRMPVPQQSIIVDDDVALTEPLSRSGSEPRHPSAESRADHFVTEMTVLIKYGHAEQVPREIERWLRANPDDLDAHVRIAEFELSRLNAAAGLDRLFTLASRAMDRGHQDLARRVFERVARESPKDLRVLALQERLSRR